MHVYRRVMEERKWLFTVGYWAPAEGGRWVWEPLEDTSDENEARALVNYLNGGLGRKG